MALDVPPHRLPLNAWSSARNVRFTDGKALRIGGHAAVFDPPPLAFKWGLHVPTEANLFWMLATLAKVQVHDGSTYTDITRLSGDYNASDAHLWNGGVLGGIPVINNGIDVPQAWNPPTAATKLVDLPNWPAGFTARVVRPFKSFLVALNVHDGTDRFRHRVRWSHSADPGTLPDSWSLSDPTKDSGEVDLTDIGAGELLYMDPLGDQNMLYKTGSTWAMRFVGGTAIFAFEKVFETIGLLTAHCVRTVPRTRNHFMVTAEDIVVHNGVEAQSVVDRRVRRAVFGAMDVDNFDRSFVVQNVRQDELWFCFPTSGQTQPDRALIWNYSDGTITERDLPGASHIAVGAVFESADDTWDPDSQAWDADTTVWDAAAFRRQQFDMLMMDPGATKLHLVESGQDFNGMAMAAHVERTGLAVTGVDRGGTPTVDFSTRKLVRRIWPKIEGGPVEVRVGAQEAEGGPVEYSVAQTFTPGVDRYIDPVTPVNGRFIAVRFESSNAGVPWELSGYDLEVEQLGAF